MSATVTLKFRPSQKPGHKGSLSYRVIHNRHIRQVGSECHIYPNEWSEDCGAIVIPKDCSVERRNALTQIKMIVSEEMGSLSRIITSLDKRGRAYTVDEIMERYYIKRSKAEGFVAYARRLIENLKPTCPVKAERYRTCINSFVKFLGEGEDVPLDLLDASLMVSYEGHLQKRGLCANSTSFHMRNLRSIYNFAVADMVTEQHNPFRKVYTGISATRKRAIPMSDIAKIRLLDLSDKPGLAYTRDIFVLQLIMQGISFVDLAYLKKTDIKDGVLTYYRHKTGQKIVIKWLDEMQRIVDRYADPSSDFLLPIIKDPAGNMRRQYQNALHLINKRLKIIAAKAGIETNLTSYTTRHSWASNANEANVPLKTISRALGHTSEDTTAIYLAQLDTADIDRANLRVLKSLNKETERQRKRHG